MEALLAQVQAEAQAEAAAGRTGHLGTGGGGCTTGRRKAQLEQKTAEYDALVSGLLSEIDAGQVTITELSGKLPSRCPTPSCSTPGVRR